ncbi:FAD dependent oxidoreductase [Alloactinosynnema sp. L-07]|uniref:FAD-binding oxidoreductase n=1 Tax=Alloactinosynnema sp. L-07 TaxID=1653480 RepID=UPI00065EEFF4|nr:FAD-binding oxidoreductase [Alloactinosynnema sp. L-07]CRK56168.1 FAD dependent oxidoreductase [Alloactinosynnema sp. L-07]
MALARRLAAVVGVEHVLTDPAVCAGFATDWTGRYRGSAALVVRPADRDQVAGVLSECQESGVAVVPQGGNTGLVGGGVPHNGEVLLNLTRLDSLGPVDRAARQVTAGAGVRLSALRAHAGDAGLDFAVDIAARDSATVGGMVATNAGGLRVLRWGSMREQVAGVEAVLADGSRVGSLAGLGKDSTGYDLAGGLIGSEGTLAVITAVRLRLVPSVARRATATLAFASTADAVAAVSELRAVPSLTSAEVFYDDGLRLVCAHRDLAPPFPTAYPVYLLVECADDADPTEALGAAVADIPGVLDTALAVDEAARRTLWTHREAHTETVNSLGTPLKLDVGVPVAHAAAFEREIRAAVASGTLVLFGHLAEGNFHVNVVGADDEERITETILRAAAAHGGTISAEHGVGVAKAAWLSLTRSPAERDLYAAIKHAWDPRGVLNPGVLIPR